MGPASGTTDKKKAALENATKRRWEAPPTEQEIADACAAIRGTWLTVPKTENIFEALLRWSRSQVDSLEEVGGPAQFEGAAHAIAWVEHEGEIGPGISFRDCCDALRVRVDNARRVFRRYCKMKLSPDTMQNLHEYVRAL